ncbi:MAG: RNA polymerase sigma factor (sigma-70 family) [Planctomycetota bacterium]|jgi:RNA polymerase sigma factor (sigma-70 family)
MGTKNQDMQRKNDERDQDEPPTREVVLAALDEFEPSLLALAGRITGDAERAQDVVQEVFLRLCRARRGEVEDHLAAWLHTVCRNQALDVRRKERRMRELANGVGEDRVDSNPTPDQTAEKADEVGNVLGTIARLPEKQREALKLKFQQGLSYGEIAAAMETSAGNVGWLLHHGLKALRERLGVGAPDPGVAGPGVASSGLLSSGMMNNSEGSLGGATQ